MHCLDADVGSGNVGEKFHFPRWDTTWRAMNKRSVAGTARIAQERAESSIFMKLSQYKEKCDENHMQAGISGIHWKDGHICLPVPRITHTGVRCYANLKPCRSTIRW